MPSIARELDYTTPQRIGRAEPDYPFEQFGDYATFVLVETYKQTRAGYLADKAANLYRPGSVTHPDYPDAWLCSTSKPVTTTTGLYQFTRTWSTVPALHYEPASRLFDRPVLHDLKSGSTYAVSFDDGATSHLFTSRVSVSSVGAITQATTSIAVAAEALTALPAETFTITDANNNSVSPYLNSGASSIRSSIAAACTAITGLEVFSSQNSLTINYAAATVKSISTSASVSMSAGSSGVIFTTLRASQTDTEVVARPTRAITTGSAHSGAAGDWVALWNGDKLVAMTKAVAASGSSITVFADEGPLAVGNTAITHCAFAPNAAHRISNRGVDASCRYAHRFYLPGVTPGIATISDVPSFTPATDPVSWLDVVVAYLASPSPSTYAIIETSALANWNGPIIQKAVLEIQLSDVVIAVSTSA